MSRVRAQFIPDLLEEHFEEIQFLWAQRQSALRSDRYSLAAFLDLEERIEAHVQGLLAIPEGLVALTPEKLASDDSETVFAAAYVLLRMGSDDQTRLVLDAFSQAVAERLGGLRDALANASGPAIHAELQKHIAGSRLDLAAAAIEILARVSEYRDVALVYRLLQSEEPQLRESGWRTAAVMEIVLKPESYAAGLREKDEAIRSRALLAGVSARVPGVLDVCRHLAKQGSPDHLNALILLATLGTTSDLETILALGNTEALGPARYRLLGTYGHPAVIPVLLQAMRHADPEIAAAAGTAFTKITGDDVSSGKRMQVPASDGNQPNEFEQEFLDEVMLPDPGLAQELWQKNPPAKAQATRLCRGIDLSMGFSAPALPELDMESRWETYVRGKFSGIWKANLADLDRFPQQFGRSASL